MHKANEFFFNHRRVDRNADRLNVIFNKIREKPRPWGD